MTGPGQVNRQGQRGKRTTRRTRGKTGTTKWVVGLRREWTDMRIRVERTQTRGNNSRHARPDNNRPTDIPEFDDTVV